MDWIERYRWRVVICGQFTIAKEAPATLDEERRNKKATDDGERIKERSDKSLLITR